MAEQQREFGHESLQDRQSLVQYLAALADGLKHGQLVLSSNGERLELNAPPLVKFDLQAKTKRNRSQIVLKISWKHHSLHPELKVEPLQIEIETTPESA